MSLRNITDQIEAIENIQLLSEEAKDGFYTMVYIITETEDYKKGLIEIIEIQKNTRNKYNRALFDIKTNSRLNTVEIIF